MAVDPLVILSAPAQPQPQPESAPNADSGVEPINSASSPATDTNAS